MEQFENRIDYLCKSMGVCNDKNKMIYAQQIKENYYDFIKKKIYNQDKPNQKKVTIEIPEFKTESFLDKLTDMNQKIV